MPAVKPRAKKRAPRAVHSFEIPQLVPRQEPEKLFPKFAAAFLGGILGGLLVLLAGRHWVESRLASGAASSGSAPAVAEEVPKRATPRPRHTPSPARQKRATVVPAAAESEDSKLLAGLEQEGKLVLARLDPCATELSGQEASDLCDAWKDKTFAALTRLNPDLVAAFDNPGRGARAYVPAACQKFREEIAVYRQDMERHLAALAEIHQKLQPSAAQ